MTAIVVTLAASLLGSIAQTTVGFGIALFLSPVMFLLLDPEQAVLCTLTAATTLSVLMLLGERGHLALDRRASLGLLLSMVPGVLLGALLLGLLDKAYLQIAVGVVVLAFVAAQERGREGTSRAEREFGFRPAAVPSGFLAGALNASVSTGGPPVAIWLRSVGASPNQIRHTLAVVFVAMNLLTIAVVVALDSPQISGEWGRALGGAILGVPLGYAVGGRVLDRIDRETFERFVVIAITAIALLSAANGLSGL